MKEKIRPKIMFFDGKSTTATQLSSEQAAEHADGTRSDCPAGGRATAAMRRGNQTIFLLGMTGLGLAIAMLVDGAKMPAKAKAQAQNGSNRGESSSSSAAAAEAEAVGDDAVGDAVGDVVGDVVAENGQDAAEGQAQAQAELESDERVPEEVGEEVVTTAAVASAAVATGSRAASVASSGGASRASASASAHSKHSAKSSAKSQPSHTGSSASAPLRDSGTGEAGASHAQPPQPPDYKKLYLAEKKRAEITEAISNVKDYRYKGDGSDFSKRIYFMREAYRRSREATPIDATAVLLATQSDPMTFAYDHETLQNARSRRRKRRAAA